MGKTVFAFVGSKGKYRVLAWYGRSFISRQNESCPTRQCPKKFLRDTSITARGAWLACVTPALLCLWAAILDW